jgi:DNA mismatch repair protein MutS2
LRQRDLTTLEFPRVLDAIARHTRSGAGRLAVLALEPSGDAGEVERRLGTLAEVIAVVAEAGPPPTADLPAAGPALSAAAPEGAALEPRRLAEVRDLIAAGRSARAWLRRDGERRPSLAARAAALPDLRNLEGALAGALDETGLVRDDASPELAAARTLVRELRREMEGRLERFIRDPAMTDLVSENYVTLRSGRFVVPIRTAVAGAVTGVVQDRSTSGETVFVEPLFAVELNNRLLLAAKDEELAEWRVRAELTALVREAAPDIELLERALGELDALGAAAAFATRHGCTRPTIGAADVHLPAARHPLLLETGRPVVPVDIRIPRERRGLAITGPNAGGKTVTLKCLGLSAAMAQAGLFVPAGEGSLLPLFQAILVDIGDDQSIERDLSTFSAHAENLAAIATAAGPETLVLLDEPGVGTDPIEGAAIAVGVLTDIVERGPRLAFTSHFPQVKVFALASPALDVAAFEVDPKTGAPSFTLRYHTVGQSFALPIARRHGLPARALETAEKILAGESHDLARAVERLEESRSAFEARRAELERETAKLAAARAEAEGLVADLKARQKRRWEEDLDDSRRFLRDLEVRGRNLIEELRTQPDPVRLRRFVRERATEVRARNDALGPGAPQGRAPVPGDTVELAGRGIRGELVEIMGDRARIRRGGLRFEVPASQLRLVDAAAPRERVGAAVERPAPETEINLVGQRARDAIDALGAFLDRAVRAGVPEVRVVHGIGTGTLRRAVREFLETTPYCAGYRDAEPTAGGVGVTVADLS